MRWRSPCWSTDRGGRSFTVRCVPDLTYEAGSGQLSAYLAVPRTTSAVARGGRDPGRARAVRRHPEQADRLAAAGYLAFAPDLYSGRGVRCVLATLQASRSGKGAAYGDIEAARTWLEAAGGLHRADRDHRLLHGRRVRGDDAPTAVRLRCGARSTTASCRRTRPSASRTRARSSAATGGATRCCAAGRRAARAGAERRTASRTTSRSTPTPGTASSTGSTPARGSIRS